MPIPIITTHFGAQPYVLACLRETARHNREFFFIGDQSNEFYSREVPTIHWIDHRALPLSLLAQSIIESFVNYSTNPHEFEQRCFIRMFYVQSLVDRLSCDCFFHVDSDCALLVDINSIKFHMENALAVYSDFGNPLRMAASVHNARLNKHFLQRFGELSEEIYVRGTGTHLIAEKIRYHREQQAPGGICDMTLYHLMTREMPVQNLGTPVDGRVFDYRFWSGEGDELQDQYAVAEGHKVLYEHPDGIYIKDLRGFRNRLLSIHFGGDAKAFVGVLDRMGNGRTYVVEGRESDGWMREDALVRIFRVEEGKQLVLNVDVSEYLPYPVTLQARARADLVETVKVIRPGRYQIRIPLNRPGTVQLYADRWFVPAELGINSDLRKLSYRLLDSVVEDYLRHAD